MNFLIAIPFGKYFKNRSKYFGGPVMNITAGSKKAALTQYIKHLETIGKSGLTIFPPAVIGRYLFNEWRRTNFNVSSVEFTEIIHGDWINAN